MGIWGILEGVEVESGVNTLKILGRETCVDIQQGSGAWEGVGGKGVFEGL